MLDSTQILLFTVVTSLTVLLIIIGIQIFFILKEVRKIFQKLNIMMNDATVVTGTISKSVTQLSGFSTGLKTVLGVLNIFTKKEGIKHDGK